MARTRASVAAKVATGKSSKARCGTAPPSNTNGVSGTRAEKSSKMYSGGNPVCPRETPKWQKPITNFFIQNQTVSKSEHEVENIAEAGSSKSKPKRPIIHSDDEDEQDKPKNKELDETIDLEPLTGEDSHKIDEYYPKNGTHDENDKENVDVKRNKRSLDESISTSEEVERNSKKVKVI